MISKFYKKGRYADLSIILGLMVTIVAFLIKTAEYVRLYLVFSMYKIDGSYVEVDDKALFKAIGILEAVIIYFLINFVICFVRLNNSRVKRTIIMILIYGAELTSIYMFAFSLVRMPVASLKGMAIKHDFASKSVYIDTSATKQYNKSNNDILTQYFSDINYFSRNDIELVR